MIHIEAKVKNLYVLYGEEEYLKKQYVSELKAAHLPKGAEIMNLDVYEGKGCSVDAIMNAADTMPFMNDYRVIIIKNSELFAPGRKDDSEKMNGYLAAVSETAIMIFIEDKVDKRSRLYKTAAAAGACIDFKAPSENELIKWITSFFKENNFTIRPNDAIYLLRTVSNDMEAVLTEAEKLLSYKNGHGSITRNDIDEVCTKSPETRIFDMVDAIGNKNPHTALDIYNNLLFLKEPPIRILSMIIRQFRIILWSKYLQRQGMDVNQMAATMEQKSFVVKEALRQGKNFKNKTLLNAMDDCLNCDINIKTGKIADKLGVEIIIIKYSS